MNRQSTARREREKAVDVVVEVTTAGRVIEENKGYQNMLMRQITTLNKVGLNRIEDYPRAN